MTFSLTPYLVCLVWHACLSTSLTCSRDCPSSALIIVSSTAAAAAAAPVDSLLRRGVSLDDMAAQVELPEAMMLSAS